jgi:hypothetical protein
MQILRFDDDLLTVSGTINRRADVTWLWYGCGDARTPWNEAKKLECSGDFDPSIDPSCEKMEKAGRRRKGEMQASTRRNK